MDIIIETMSIINNSNGDLKKKLEDIIKELDKLEQKDKEKEKEKINNNKIVIDRKDIYELENELNSIVVDNSDEHEDVYEKIPMTNLGIEPMRPMNINMNLGQNHNEDLNGSMVLISNAQDLDELPKREMVLIKMQDYMGMYNKVSNVVQQSGPYYAAYNFIRWIIPL